MQNQRTPASPASKRDDDDVGSGEAASAAERARERLAEADRLEAKRQQEERLLAREKQANARRPPKRESACWC